MLIKKGKIYKTHYISKHMLDQKDKIILEALMQNCRITTTKLAKITKLSQPSIVYRIKRLEEENYIEKYDAIIDLNLLSKKFTYFFISITNNKEQFEQKITKEKQFESLFRLAHKYNYYVSGYFTQKELKDFLQYSHKHNIEYKKYQWKAMHVTNYSIFRLPLTIEKKIHTKKIKTINTKKPILFDNTDTKLINILHNGAGRDSIPTLAKKANITYDLAIYRFKKIKKYFPLFFAQPGTKKFGIQVDILHIKTRYECTKKILKALNTIQKTMHLVELGNNEYFTQILTRTFKEYKDTLDKINDYLRDDIEYIEVYNTKEWLFVNRLNFKPEDFK